MSKKSKTTLDTTATLYNQSMLNGGWKIDARVQTTNGNALELTITQPVDQSSVTKILLYNTNLQELCDFGIKLSKIASELIRVDFAKLVTKFDAQKRLKKINK